MHIHLTDQYLQRDSIAHRLDPRTKILLALGLILAIALVPAGAFVAYGVLYLFLLLAIFSARIDLAYVLKRSFIAIPFALAAITLPFTVPGETLVTLPILGGVTISAEGTIRFVSILIKSWISVQAAILLVAITPFPDLLWGLRALHVPATLVAIVGFAYRYLFVLSDEALRLTQARTARSAVIDGQRSGGSLLWRGKVTGRMVGGLMLRSMERSERIYNAMLARGYQGQMRVLSRPHMGRQDYLILVLSIVLFVIVVSLSRIL
ncbi:MAG: cobalt ECF transporter T component CbiQ [Chloroflexota bacterium]|jgi:cobalt/nickel transport system permease protein